MFPFDPMKLLEIFFRYFLYGRMSLLAIGFVAGGIATIKSENVASAMKWISLHGGQIIGSQMEADAPEPLKQVVDTINQVRN